ncbi:MAG TPA: diacylglycerol kinase family protein [Chloroflexota bacterium]|nr:diacylglycerol kinase family protein [Chloroflexota bacterium]
MIGVIINPRSGYVAAHGVDHMRRLIEGSLPDARLHVLQPGEQVEAICRDFLAAGVACIAAAGGDGTVSSVASMVVGTETALGVIPAGTLNHFARDIDVGRDVPEALRVLAHGYVMPVDVARVNDRIFLNNSSIGLYARMVRIRHRYEQRLGKWRALLSAAWLVLRKARSIQVQVSDGASAEELHTYLLFVGNNQYELNLARLGRRACLNAGQLSVFTLEQPNRIQLFPQVFHLLREAHPDRRLFRSLSMSELTVIPHRRHRGPEAVACDGEVFLIDPPLVYRSVPRALRVVVPEPPPPGSREVRDNAPG